jgi:hypothetical protein
LARKAAEDAKWAAQERKRKEEAEKQPFDE